ncbi:MAG TPA: lamin tail domain-containing protein, partial [Caldithrix abyssi]|nr:lamin tail domain-containing protein [Caldithrix abyssi]
MKRVLAILLAASMLLVGSSLFAENLNLTFEDDSDVSNWGNYDQDNMWTSASWDATGGVDGTGALKLHDGGWGFLSKRPITATIGNKYRLTVSVKTTNWADPYFLYLKVEGIGETDSVAVNSDGVFTTYTLMGTVTADSGYIKFEGMNTGTESDVWVDNLVFEDGLSTSDIVINEIYYNPPTIQGDDSDWEFLELFNTTDRDIPLEGYAITEGIKYTFVQEDTIKANSYFVLAYNAANYPGSVQWTSGGLKNSGEDIVLKDAAGNTVDSVDYDDHGDWSWLADGKGASLSLADPYGDHNDPANWYPSAFGGTPGEANGPRGVWVNFRANTATVPDTMSKNSVVQVRGSNPPLEWNGGSLIFLENEAVPEDDPYGSSDYWVGGGLFPAEVTYYKFYTNASHNTVSPGVEWEHQGWEANVDPASNDRILDLTGFTGSDTTLPVQYVNGWADKPGQYAHPWESNDTSFVVWL